MITTTIITVCERLFEELIKELLMSRYVIVSACKKEKNGRKVLVRKAHLRRRKR